MINMLPIARSGDNLGERGPFFRRALCQQISLVIFELYVNSSYVNASVNRSRICPHNLCVDRNFHTKDNKLNGESNRLNMVNFYVLRLTMPNLLNKLQF